MRKIICVGCGGKAEFESELFPTIRICFQCARGIGGWLVKNCPSALDNNILVTDLLDGTWSQPSGSPDGFNIVHQSPHSDDASATTSVKRFGN